MDKEQVQQLIIKYKNGLCTEDEIQLLFQWIDEEGIGKTDYLFEDHAAENTLKEEVRANIKQRLFTVKSTPVFYKMQFWLKIAAVLLVIGTISILIIQNVNKNEAEVYTTIYNPPGHVKTVILPDGSKAFLNAATTIRFQHGFSHKTRKVILTGEAYFEVVHNPEKPFVVFTRNIRTQVLGTSFDVKAYHNDSNIKIGVISGKVGVMLNRSSLMLTPDQTASYNAKTGKLLKSQLEDASSLKMWTSGQLIFRNETMDDISRILTRRYDVSIIIQNEQVRKEILNARFDKNESLENVISVLCAYVGARYKYEGNKYFIR